MLIKQRQEIKRKRVMLEQWRRQNFSLEGTKLKDDIKNEINLKNITQQ